MKAHTHITKYMFASAFFFCFCTFYSSQSLAAPGEPKLLAVKFHADWCGACQRMGKSITHLKNKLDGRSILFVTLDMTNQTRKRSAGYLAHALGLKKVWKRYHNSTGYILLIDRASGKVRAKLTSKMSLKSMTKRIVRAL